MTVRYSTKKRCKRRGPARSPDKWRGRNDRRRPVPRYIEQRRVCLAGKLGKRQYSRWFRSHLENSRLKSKPAMRLNGWQRIGIVASVCWFVVGGFWINSLVINGLGASVKTEYRHCLDRHSFQPDGSVPADTDWGPCDKKFEADWSAAVADHWSYAAAYTLIPIPIAWLVVYGLVALVRWIKAGFATPI
jgi:hypothetical protein